MNSDISIHLEKMPLKYKKVLYRVDINVPIDNGIIQDAFRLERIIPTLNYLLNQHAKILIVTHLGNPIHPDPAYSTQQLLSWFSALYPEVHFAPSLELAQTMLSSSNPGSITLLENIRFFPKEKNHDEKFARRLFTLTDMYVNDAFGIIHRNDTSVALLPTLFKPSEKSIGFLMHEELKAFKKFNTYPIHNRLIVLGGAKIKTKMTYIPGLLQSADKILICPPLSFCFDKAQGYTVGTSLIEASMIPMAQELLKIHHNSLVLPVDYYVQENDTIHIVSANAISKNAKGIAIGPQTLALFNQYIKKTTALLFNGGMGFINEPKTLASTKKLLENFKKSSAFIIAGGGDTIHMIHALHMTPAIDFLSTGGGSALALLAHKILPGLESMKING